MGSDGPGAPGAPQPVPRRAGPSHMKRTPVAFRAAGGCCPSLAGARGRRRAGPRREGHRPVTDGGWELGLADGRRGAVWPGAQRVSIGGWGTRCGALPDPSCRSVAVRTL